MNSNCGSAIAIDVSFVDRRDSVSIHADPCASIALHVTVIQDRHPAAVNQNAGAFSYVNAAPTGNNFSAEAGCHLRLLVTIDIAIFQSGLAVIVNEDARMIMAI